MTSKYLQQWRKRNKLSQIKLAEALGVTTQTVYRWENEKREIPSFLGLALESIERRGGETKAKGKKKKEKEEVKR